MIYLTFAFAIIVAVTAAGFAIALFRNPANRSKRVFTKYLGINAFAAAGIAFSIHNALPDTKTDPLENYLPTDWRQQTGLDSAATQWSDHFTAEQDEAARTKSQILQAVQTDTVVDAYVTVDEGDVDALKRTLERQIAISGGHVVPTGYPEVRASIPASYIPCLENIAELEPSKPTTAGYRQFAVSAASDRTPCPYRNGDAVNRTVRIEIEQKPVGLMLDEEDAQWSAFSFILIIPLHLALMIATYSGTETSNGSA